MTGSCPVSAHVCRETARERDELRAEVERLQEGIRDMRDMYWVDGRRPLWRDAEALLNPQTEGEGR